MQNRLKGYPNLTLYLLQMGSLDTECVMVMANYHRSDYDDMLKSILEVPIVQACVHTFVAMVSVRTDSNFVQNDCTIILNQQSLAS